MFSIGAVFLVITVTRIFFARAVHVSFTRNERRIAWVLAVVFLLANWAYVIAYVG